VKREYKYFTAPYKKKVEKEKLDPATKRPILDSSGKAVTELVEITVPYFKTVYVFDVSQTDGEPLPQLASELTGNVENYNAFFESLRMVSKFPIDFEDIPGSAKGYCSPANKKIAIRNGMSELQNIKTAIHEITHADLHAPDSELKNLTPEEKKDRRTKEVEAESVAFVVCNHFGLDTSDYSFAYVASWSSDKELTELKNSLSIIQQTAQELIDKIDEHYQELLKDPVKENQLDSIEPTYDDILYEFGSQAKERAMSLGVELEMKLPEIKQENCDERNVMTMNNNEITYYAISNDRYITYPQHYAVVTLDQRKGEIGEIHTIINSYYPNIDNAKDNEEREAIVKEAFKKHGWIENIDYKFISEEKMKNMANDRDRLNNIDEKKTRASIHDRMEAAKIKSEQQKKETPNVDLSKSKEEER
jgi:antirestriction protein ArdC